MVIEDAVLSFINQEILSSDQIQIVIDKCRKNLTSKNPEIDLIEKRLEQINYEMNKIIDLFQSDLIDKDTFEDRYNPLNKQKKTVQGTLNTLKGGQDAVEVSKEEIYEIIEHLTEEIVNADPKIVKSAIHSMIGEKRK